MCLVLDLGKICIIWKGVLVLVKLQAFLQPLLKLTYSHNDYKENGPKLVNTPHMSFFAFSGNVIIRFSGNEFSQDRSGHYSVKCHVWEKVWLLSFRSKSYWSIRLHDFSECSFSLTTWLSRMIMRYCSCTGNRIGDLVIGNIISYVFILLINELPAQHRILIVGDFNLDQVFHENAAKVDPLIESFNLSQRSQYSTHVHRGLFDLVLDTSNSSAVLLYHHPTVIILVFFQI